MKIQEAKLVEKGDRVQATAAGSSHALYYRRGDVGTVRSKAGAHFDVTLDDGRQLGIVRLENWEKVETEAAEVPQLAEEAEC